jgi:hypothetical protein
MSREKEQSPATPDTSTSRRKRKDKDMPINLPPQAPSAFSARPRPAGPVLADDGTEVTDLPPHLQSIASSMPNVGADAEGAAAKREKKRYSWLSNIKLSRHEDIKAVTLRRKTTEDDGDDEEYYDDEEEEAEEGSTSQRGTTNTSTMARILTLMRPGSKATAKKTKRRTVKRATSAPDGAPKPRKPKQGLDADTRIQEFLSVNIIFICPLLYFCSLACALFYVSFIFIIIIFIDVRSSICYHFVFLFYSWAWVLCRDKAILITL